jgi:hypothetical protein
MVPLKSSENAEQIVSFDSSFLRRSDDESDTKVSRGPEDIPKIKIGPHSPGMSNKLPHTTHLCSTRIRPEANDRH